MYLNRCRVLSARHHRARPETLTVGIGVAGDEISGTLRMCSSGAMARRRRGRDCGPDVRVLGAIFQVPIAPSNGPSNRAAAVVDLVVLPDALQHLHTFLFAEILCPRVFGSAGGVQAPPSTNRRRDSRAARRRCSRAVRRARQTLVVAVEEDLSVPPNRAARQSAGRRYCRCRSSAIQTVGEDLVGGVEPIVALESRSVPRRIRAARDRGGKCLGRSKIADGIERARPSRPRFTLRPVDWERMSARSASGAAFASRSRRTTRSSRLWRSARFSVLVPSGVASSRSTTASCSCRRRRRGRRARVGTATRANPERRRRMSRSLDGFTGLRRRAGGATGRFRSIACAVSVRLNTIRWRVDLLDAYGIGLRRVATTCRCANQ